MVFLDFHRQIENNDFWFQISPTVFNDLKSSPNASSFYPLVLTNFNLNFDNVTYAELDIPIYSALTFRLVLAAFELEDAVALPTTVFEQVCTVCL